MAQRHRNILIGGSSHVGKSTLCVALAKTLGWDLFSTDEMARHPGRPWPNVRPHVAEFYNSLSQDTIFTFLLHHHSNMWPGIQNILSDRRKAGIPCILEGSALRPEFLSELSSAQNARICLVAPASFIEQRVHVSSDYSSQPPEQRRLIDVFVERSVRDNAALYEAAEKHVIECVDVSDPTAVTHLQNRLVATAIIDAS